MNKNNHTQNTAVIVADLMVNHYNATGAMVFGHMSYFICKYGTFDGAPSSVANRLQCSPNTVHRYIEKFIKAGLLKEVAGKYDYRNALVFGDNKRYEPLFNAYLCMYDSNRTKPTNDGISLVRLDLKELPQNVLGKQAEYKRCVMFAKGYMRDKMHNQSLNDNGSVFYADYYTKLAKQFGLCVNTIKKITSELTRLGYIMLKRELGRLIIFADRMIRPELKDKAKVALSSFMDKQMAKEKDHLTMPPDHEYKPIA